MCSRSRPRLRSPRSTASCSSRPWYRPRGYFRAIAPDLFSGCDVDREWDLLSCRQAYRAAGVTRLLKVIIDETAFELRLKHPEIMTGQLRHLLA